MKVCIVLGTRPEIIKCAPIIRELIKRKIPYILIHSGQHYSYEMDQIFFKELELPKSDYALNVGSGEHGEQTAKMVQKLEEIFQKEKISVVLVEGDTNTVLAGALAATKLHIPIGHVEAGLRSYDRSMPEEINRIITDHISDYLFVPTAQSIEYLKKEGLTDGVYATGNTVVDATYDHIQIAEEKSDALERLKLEPKSYILMTMHRAENVDNKDRLEHILESVEIITNKYKIPIVFSIHPRTKKMITEYKLDKYLKNDRLLTVEPVGYLDSLKLQKYAKLIMTDSGGMQEEACILGTPSVTLRDNTERPEAIAVGASRLAGADTAEIVKSIEIMMNTKAVWTNPFGDGIAAQKIVSIVYSRSKQILPDFGAKRPSVLGLEIDPFKTEFFVDLMKRFIERGGFHLIITLNPEMTMAAQKDSELKKVIESADLVTADGIGMVIAGKILDMPIPERVTGIDLCYRLFEIANKNKNKVYFLGATNDIIEKAAKRVKKDYKNLDVVGFHHGYFKKEESKEIVSEIRKSGAEIVIVGMGSPLQEKWIFENREELDALCLGVGGSFDVLSGEIARAPKWTQKLGIEWLYRTIQQPKRIKRVVLNLPIFIIKVIDYRLNKVK
jgi:UDP-N-acetylglucosamine 2-epimerase (non-hydrolysing)